MFWLGFISGAIAAFGLSLLVVAFFLSRAVELDESTQQSRIP